MARINIAYLTLVIVTIAGQAIAQTGSSSPTVVVRPTGSPVTLTPRNVFDVLGDQLSILDFGAKCDGTYASLNVSIASGSSSLTTSSPLPVTPLSGQSISVTGAGASGASLATTITSFSSSGGISTFVLGAQAQTSVSSQEDVVYGTDDTNAVIAAGASGRRIIVPDGLICNAPMLPLQQNTLAGNFVGGGKIATQVNVGTSYQAVEPRGPQFSAVRAAPNPGVLDSCSYGFPCWAKYDYSHALSAEEFHVSGGATLGQPTTGYESMPGAAPHNLFIDNNSGWNYSHNSNGGRTGGGAYGTVMQQGGGGDFGVFGAHIQCGGSVPPGDGNTTPGPDGSIINGFTDWLGVPECGFIGATIDALAPGQYLQLGEFPVSDNGYDVTAIGYTRGYQRTATTAKINNRWIDELLTCNLGLTTTLPCDAQQMIAGSWYIGHSFIGANMTGAAVAMSAGQKITLNGSGGPASPYAEGNPPLKFNLGGDWITSDGSNVVIAQNGGPAARLSNPANPVNYWQVTGGATGGGVSLAATGADAQIASVLADKGGGGVYILSGGQAAARFAGSANTSGYLNVAAGTTTSPLGLQVYTLGNMDMTLSAAGTGLVRIAGTAPGSSDNGSAVATTAMVQGAARSAVGAMIGNRYEILNVGSGAVLQIPVPAGVIDQMIVEIEPNSATIANMALTMPVTSAIPDGFIVHFVCTGTVTSFSLSGTGQTVVGAPGTISPTTPVAFMWDTGLADWLPFR